MNNKLKALFWAIITQALLIAIIFFGFILDPLLGVWATVIYIVVIGSLLMFSFFLNPSVQNRCKL